MSLRLKLWFAYGVLVATGALAIGTRALPADKAWDSLPLPVRIWRRTPALVSVVWHGPTARYRATRELRVGHRLHADDFAPADGVTPDVSLRLPAPGTLVGKYIRHDIARGAVIAPELVGDVLEVWPPTGRELLRVWMGGNQAKLAQNLDVGWTVDLCDGTSCVIHGSSVAGVECQNGTSPGCAVTLAVTRDEKQSFLNNNHKDKLTVVVSEPTSGG